MKKVSGRIIKPKPNLKPGAFSNLTNITNTNAYNSSGGGGSSSKKRTKRNLKIQSQKAEEAEISKRRQNILAQIQMLGKENIENLQNIDESGKEMLRNLVRENESEGEYRSNDTALTYEVSLLRNLEKKRDLRKKPGHKAKEKEQERSVLRRDRGSEEKVLPLRKMKREKSALKMYQRNQSRGNVSSERSKVRTARNQKLLDEIDELKKSNIRLKRRVNNEKLVSRNLRNKLKEVEKKADEDEENYKKVLSKIDQQISTLKNTNMQLSLKNNKFQQAQDELDVYRQNLETRDMKLRSTLEFLMIIMEATFSDKIEGRRFSKRKFRQNIQKKIVKFFHQEYEMIKMVELEDEFKKIIESMLEAKQNKMNTSVSSGGSRGSRMTVEASRSVSQRVESSKKERRRNSEPQVMVQQMSGKVVQVKEFTKKLPFSELGEAQKPPRPKSVYSATKYNRRNPFDNAEGYQEERRLRSEQKMHNVFREHGGSGMKSEGGKTSHFEATEDLFGTKISRYEIVTEGSQSNVDAIVRSIGDGEIQKKLDEVFSPSEAQAYPDVEQIYKHSERGGQQVKEMKKISSIKHQINMLKKLKSEAHAQPLISENARGSLNLLNQLKMGANENYNTSNSTFAVSKHSYKAEWKNDLSFKKGQKLRIIDKKRNGWWLAELCDELNDQIGYVPSNYLTIIE